MERVLDLHRLLGGRLGEAIDRDVFSPAPVVTDVPDVDARTAGAGADRNRLPILDFHAGEAHAPGHGPFGVECQELAAGIVVRPQPPRRPAADGDAAAFRQFRDTRGLAGGLTLRRGRWLRVRYSRVAK